MNPKIIYEGNNHRIFWCPREDHQMLEAICHKKFKQSNLDCKTCLGKVKREHWPEPWASLGKGEEANEEQSCHS